MMSLKMDYRLLISQQNQKEIGLLPIVNITKTSVNEILLRHVLLIENTVLITLMRPVLLIENTGIITLVRHLLLLSDTVLTTPLLAALKLAGRKTGDGVLDFSPFVSNGILTIPAKIVDEFGLCLLKVAFERNAVRMAYYGMMPHVN